MTIEVHCANLVGPRKTELAALQRQLNYPEVPRPKPRDDAVNKLDEIQRKLQELETRLKLLESEVRGQVDLSKFGKPEILEEDDEEA